MSEVIVSLQDWAKERQLPFWEQYALNRILCTEKLNHEDFDCIFGYALEENELKEKNEEWPALEALETGFCAIAEQPEKPILCGIRDLQNINALVSSQKITFSPQLTAIYGENRSGKSGYARVLANACFCRGDAHVLHDVSKPDTETSSKTAMIDVKDSTGMKPISFTVDEKKPELRKMYVHDSASIVAQLTKENEFSFAPVGLEIMTRLVEAVDEVNKRFDSEIEKLSKSQDFAALFPEGETQVSKLVSSLSEDTDKDSLEKLATLTETDKSQVQELVAEIAKLQSSDIKEELGKIKQAMEDLQSLIENIHKIGEGLDSEAVGEMDKLIGELKSQKAIAQAVSIDQFKTPLFSQIGTEQWQKFIQSAKELAMAESKANAPYPQSGDHCLLCRQQLQGKEIELIRRLWAFLENEAQREINKISGWLSARQEGLQSMDFNFFTTETAVYRFIQEREPSVGKDVEAHLQQSSERLGQLIVGIDALEIKLTINMPDSPESKLREMIEGLQNNYNDLKGKSPEAEISKKRDRLLELRHRKILNEYLGAISGYLDDLQWVKKARESKRSTRHISEQQKRLFEQLVTPQYIDTFKTNLRELGRPLPVEIVTRPEKGTSLKRIALHGFPYPESILSSGEKRIVSLADFLTEVTMDQCSCGIILDDPVTSLDIEWKEHVAGRLAKECLKRQVIIFTHDLHFLYLLEEKAKELEIDVEFHWIKRSTEKDQPGYIFLKNSPATERHYKKPKIAEEHLQKAKGSANPVDQQKHLQQGFGALRTTYEAFVIFELFGGVVERFQERIRPDSLSKVVLDKDIFGEVKNKIARLSRYIEGHLHSDVYAGRKPGYEILEEEIQDFYKLRQKARGQKKDTE